VRGGCGVFVRKAESECARQSRRESEGACVRTEREREREMSDRERQRETERERE